MTKILVIDDAEEVREVVKTVLQLKGFSVMEAANGKQGLSMALKENPDLIVLDLMLPDMDGIEVCQSLRQNPRSKLIPILMLTARTGVYDRVKGLEIGADDYLVKPFETLELLARVNALLRRRAEPTDGPRSSLKAGWFEMNPANYTISVNGKPVKNLTPREFDILYVLAKNSPQPVNRNEIFQAMGEKEQKDSTRVIDIHIAKIRKKIGPQRIKTISGKGYLLSTQ